MQASDIRVELLHRRKRRRYLVRFDVHIMGPINFYSYNRLLKADKAIAHCFQFNAPMVDVV